MAKRGSNQRNVQNQVKTEKNSENKKRCSYTGILFGLVRQRKSDKMNKKKETMRLKTSNKKKNGVK